MEVICDNCGKKFNKPKAWIKRVNHNFCSHKCFGQWHSKTPTKIPSTKLKLYCEECGKEIYKYRAWAKRLKHHFCSRRCSALWKSKNLRGSNNPKYNSRFVKCSYCGNSVLKPSYIIEGSKNYFCNSKCFGRWCSKKMLGKNNPAWLGGHSFEPYSKNWNERLRRQIRERDNYICQLCGKVSSKTVHHIDYNKKNSVPENLITLCHGCNIYVNTNREYWTMIFQTKIQYIS